VSAPGHFLFIWWIFKCRVPAIFLTVCRCRVPSARKDGCKHCLFNSAVVVVVDGVTTGPWMCGVVLHAASFQLSAIVAEAVSGASQAMSAI